MFLCTFASINASPVSGAYYDRKRTQGKRLNQAIITLARQHTDVLYDGAFYTETSPTQVALATLRTL